MKKILAIELTALAAIRTDVNRYGPVHRSDAFSERKKKTEMLNE